MADVDDVTASTTMRTSAIFGKVTTMKSDSIMMTVGYSPPCGRNRNWSATRKPYAGYKLEANRMLRGDGGLMEMQLCCGNLTRDRFLP